MPCCLSARFSFVHLSLPACLLVTVNSSACPCLLVPACLSARYCKLVCLSLSARLLVTACLSACYCLLVCSSLSARLLYIFCGFIEKCYLCGQRRSVVRAASFGCATRARRVCGRRPFALQKAMNGGVKCGLSRGCLPCFAIWARMR